MSIESIALSPEVNRSKLVTACGNPPLSLQELGVSPCLAEGAHAIKSFVGGRVAEDSRMYLKHVRGPNPFAKPPSIGF